MPTGKQDQRSSFETESPVEKPTPTSQIIITNESINSSAEEKKAPPKESITINSVEEKSNIADVKEIDFNSPVAESSPQDPDQIANLPRFFTAHEQEKEGSHDLANYNYHLAYDDQSGATSTIPTSSTVEKKEAKGQESTKRQEQNSKIAHLNQVLKEFDGGPSAGMKTRKFLRLCAALNEQGFFSEFSANKKEVFIKTDTLVTVMHTNHSKKKKSPGISGNTAKKLQEVIESIQK